MLYILMEMKCFLRALSSFPLPSPLLPIFVPLPSPSPFLSSTHLCFPFLSSLPLSLSLFPFHFLSTYFYYPPFSPPPPSPPPSSSYQMSKGSELMLDVSPSTTVGDLRKVLYGTIGLPLEHIEIKCQVSLLHSTSTY